MLIEKLLGLTAGELLNIASSFCQLAMQPRLCHCPPAFDRRFGDAESFCRFRNIQATEETKLNDSRKALVFLFESFKSLIEINKIEVGVAGRKSEGSIDTHILLRAAASYSVFRFGVLDKDTPHQRRGDREEL
jgi:hypothetical protein